MINRVQNEGRVQIGKTDISVTPLGVGTWQWGDRLSWGFGGSYHEEDVHQAFSAALAAGINFFDTAELYGRGRSETFLGQFLSQTDVGPVVATKFMPLPWRLSRNALGGALRDSLRRLRLQRVDLYQMHWPSPPVPIETWMAALAEAIEQGLARAAGVSNYSAAQMRRAHTALARRGIPLASNQVQYSLLHRAPERQGILDACRELGVTLIAYSPLAKGMLTGKYSPENPPPGLRRLSYRPAYLARVQPLTKLLRELGEGHGGKTASQVALNWTICKGAIPIPGVKNARQVVDNAGALGWRLTDDEVAALDAASAEV